MVQAFAERSPVVIINGAPGIGEHLHSMLVHHKVRDFETQQKVFAELMVGVAGLDDAETAAAEIDRVMALARRHSRPVYIEIPRDMVTAELAPPRKCSVPPEDSDPEILRTAVTEAAERIRAAARPVILAGVELHRFHLQVHQQVVAKST